MSTSLPSRALQLLLSCALASVAAAAQIRYPSNPQTQADCDGPAQQWKDQYRREHDAGSQLHAQSNAIQAPPGCFGNDHCRSNYYATKKRLHEQISAHYRERDRIEREGSALDRACRATARAHEQRAEQQRRMAEEQRRQIEQQQREAVARQQDMQRQQQALQQQQQQQQAAQQAAQQRQVAAQQQAQQQHQQEAYRAQQAEQQRQFATQQRQAAEQQSRMIEQQQAAAQQRVQQQANQMAAQQQLAAQLGAIQRESERAQAQEQQRAAVAAAAADAARASRQYSRLNSAVNERDAATSVARTQDELSRQVSAAAGHARREAMDAAINPGGASYARIDAGVDAAKDLNSQINRSRGVTPLATQIANDAYSAIGSMQNRTLAELDRALAPANLDALNVPPPAAARPAPAPVARPPLSSLDGLAGSADPPPPLACQPLDVLIDGKPGKAGERRRNADGVAHECRNGKWERSVSQ